MREQYEQLRGFLLETLWRLDAAGLSRPRRILVRFLRTSWALGRDLLEGQITLRAMSLVYTTLLSIVPLLAVSFSVLKAFGAHNQIKPILLNLLLPLGPQGAEITNQIIDFVDNIQVGVLGFLGTALLLYTVIAMVQKIENACNEMWHVSSDRPLLRRFSDYLSVILVGPVLMFSAMGIMASLANSAVVQYIIAIQPFGIVLEIIGRIVPYLLVIAAFTFLYVFVPNTRVRIKPAFIGAFVAGVLWATLGWIFATFIAASSQYTAIYSAFATLILFMFWLYLSWVITLVGSKVAFYVQHPEFATRKGGEVRLSNRQQEELGLAVMLGIGRAFDQARPAPREKTLVDALQVPPDAVSQVLALLAGAGLIRAVAQSEAGWQPARPLGKITVAAVLDALRRGREDHEITGLARREPSVAEVLARVDRSRDEALAARTIQDLL